MCHKRIKMTPLLKIVGLSIFRTFLVVLQSFFQSSSFRAVLWDLGFLLLETNNYINYTRSIAPVYCIHEIR